MKKPNTILQESYYYPLFEYMADNHGLTLLDGEMQEIERVVLGLKKNGLVGKINRIVSEIFLSGDESKLFIKTKKERVVNARQSAMYLIAKYHYPEITHDEIGKIYNLERSATSYSISAARDRIETDVRYAMIIKLLEGLLEDQMEEFQPARQTDDVCVLPTGNKVQPTTSQARG